MTKWTDEEIEYLKNYYSNGTKDDLLLNLNHSWKGIKSKAFHLNLIRVNCWIDKEIKYLKNNYNNKDKETLMFELNHSWMSIKKKAFQLKLTKGYWTNNEIEYLKNNYFDEKKENLMLNLDRSWIAIMAKAGSLKLKKNIYGENNPRYKNGISSIPFEKEHDMTFDGWKKIAQQIRKRDNFICQYCGKYPSTSVHHIIPRRIKIDNSPNNLITLCRSCHKKVECLTDKYLEEEKDPIEIFYEKWSNF